LLRSFGEDIAAPVFKHMVVLEHKDHRRGELLVMAARAIGMMAVQVREQARGPNELDFKFLSNWYNPEYPTFRLSEQKQYSTVVKDAWRKIVSEPFVVVSLVEDDGLFSSMRLREFVREPKMGCLFSPVRIDVAMDSWQRVDAYITIPMLGNMNFYRYNHTVMTRGSAKEDTRTMFESAKQKEPEPAKPDARQIVKRAEETFEEFLAKRNVDVEKLTMDDFSRL
jgi:hypothetical protein